MADIISALKQVSQMDNYTQAQLRESVSGVNLNDAKTLEQFTRLVQELIDNNDARLALVARYVLEDVLLEQSQKTIRQSPEIYGKYLDLIALLKFMNLSIRGMGEITQLVQDHLVAAFGAGIPIKEKFQEVLDAFDDFLMEGQIAESLAKAMGACEEIIGGSALLKDANKKTPQTLGNWLTDYIQFSLSGAEHVTGSLERIQYFKSNPNAKVLSEEDKKLLLEIFRIYDWLRYGSKEDKEPSGIDDYVNAQQFKLPEDVLQNPQLKQPPATPQPPHTKIAQIMEEIKRPQASAPPQQKEKAFGNENNDEILQKIRQVQDPVRQAGLPQVRPVNIQDILNSKDSSFAKATADGKQDNSHRPGLNIGDMQFGGSNSMPAVRPPVSAPQPVNQKEDEINKKLEDLKKKIQP